MTRWLVLLLLGFLLACGGPQPGPTKGGKGGKGGKATPGQQSGKASWYGGRHHGGPTASGERFNKNAMTAAHRRYKFGTRVKVTNKKNGRSVVVRINDRGPYTKGRIIDLSEAAAKKLDMIDAGVVPVTVEVVKN